MWSPWQNNERCLLPTLGLEGPHAIIWELLSFLSLKCWADHAGHIRSRLCLYLACDILAICLMLVLFLPLCALGLYLPGTSPSLQSCRGKTWEVRGMFMIQSTKSALFSFLKVSASLYFPLQNQSDSSSLKQLLEKWFGQSQIREEWALADLFQNQVIRGVSSARFCYLDFHLLK